MSIQAQVTWGPESLAVGTNDGFSGTLSPIASLVDDNEGVIKRPSGRWIGRRTTKVATRSWFERNAPVAQVIGAYSTLAAVVVAGLGFWHTVIPLYQKAAVDEQLARREAELRQLDQRLVRARREAYELHRSRVTDRLVTGASFDCAVRRLRLRDEAALEKPRSGSDLIAEPIEPCLVSAVGQALESSGLELEDAQLLVDETRRLGQELDQKRDGLLRRINDLPAKARDDRTLIAPYEPDVARILGEMDRHALRVAPLLGPTFMAKREEAKFQRDVGRTQYRLAAGFLGECAIDIQRHFKSIPWRSPSGTSAGG